MDVTALSASEGLWELGGGERVVLVLGLVSGSIEKAELREEFCLDLLPLSALPT